MCGELDQIALNFSETSLWILDITLCFIMFGVALHLTLADFRRVVSQPKAPIVGLLSQFLLLPALTWCLVQVVEPCPSMALGMFLVAACPGGNISNFMTMLARGNVALSVSLSAVSTSLAVVFTPLNFAFWANLYGPTQALLMSIDIDPVSIFVKILLILVFPLAAGMWVAAHWPRFTARIAGPLRTMSIFIFGGYVIAALAGNFDAFLQYAQYVILLVMAHNLLALLSGYGLAWVSGLAESERRSIAIETGIQNSGLALVLIFSPLFHGMGGMAMVAAMWGLWHIISGLSLSRLWAMFEAKALPNKQPGHPS
jgi:BASS family bile acid:Na+ symporter